MAVIVFYFSAPTALVRGWIEPGVRVVHHVHDLGWGAFAGVLLGGGVLALVFAREPRIAPMQQILLALSAAGVSMLASHALGWPHLLLGLSIAVPAGAMLALHPARRDLFRLGRPSWAMGGLALLGAIPLIRFAFHQLRFQSVDVISPHGKEFHWGTMGTLALAIAAVSILSSLQTRGWRAPAWSAGMALILYGLGSVLYPTSPSSAGAVWGSIALTGSLLFLAAAEWEHRRRGHNGREQRVHSSSVTRIESLSRLTEQTSPGRVRGGQGQTGRRRPPKPGQVPVASPATPRSGRPKSPSPRGAAAQKEGDPQAKPTGGQRRATRRRETVASGRGSGVKAARRKADAPVDQARHRQPAASR
jgi:hypothetical protein